MTPRKEMKTRAKQVLKKHWMLLVLIALIAVVIGTENVSSTAGLKASDTETTDMDAENYNAVDGGKVGLADVIEALKNGNENTGKELSNKRLKEDKASGRTRGVLSSVVNSLTSGSVFVTIFSGVNSIIKSAGVTAKLLIALSLLVSFLFWLFWRNVYVVISRRIFLEARTYKRVALNRVFFLAKEKRWMKACMTMFLEVVYSVLWWFTIVGGVIKHYSYYLVPYIVAENPDIPANEAITLSRRMMNGHKWECFVNELTFLGWYILGMVTFGLLDILFTNPYRTAFFCEYYAELRKTAKEQKLPGADYLNDTYLYEYADHVQLETTYLDVVNALRAPQAAADRKKGIFGVVERVFGLVLFVNAQERKYEEWQTREIQMRDLKAELEQEAYPGRLSNLKQKEKKRDVDKYHYIRNYSLCSIIMMFFTFSLIGWIWEVGLHLISDGEFVNRGVLQGPWLPIYGTGGVLILLLLNHFRKKPWLEFVFAIVLSGCVEYYTSYALELQHGQKWWDYSGYFLNLNGRICAEGLLVFGLGGMVIVYVVAPILDEFFLKIKLQILLPLCVILLCLFGADEAYSRRHPNMGAGITDISQLTMPEEVYRC